MKKLCLKKFVYLIGFAAILFFIVTKNHELYVKASSNVDNVVTDNSSDKRTIGVIKNGSEDKVSMYSVLSKEENLSITNEDLKTIKEKYKEKGIDDKKIRVAVLDSGVSSDCLNLYADRIEDGYNLITEEDALSTGHGDDIARLILSSTGNNVSILPIKVLDKEGKGTVTSVSDGIYKAVEENVDIINLSLNTNKSTFLDQAVKYAISKGIIVVTSAGNMGENVRNYSPSAIEDAVVVGSCNPLGVRHVFSNYGDSVDFNILSTCTSDAAAITTGLIADYIGKGNSDYLNYLDTLSKKQEVVFQTGIEEGDVLENTFLQKDGNTMSDGICRDYDGTLVWASASYRTFYLNIDWNGGSGSLQWYFVNDDDLGNVKWGDQTVTGKKIWGLCKPNGSWGNPFWTMSITGNTKMTVAGNFKDCTPFARIAPNSYRLGYRLTGAKESAGQMWASRIDEYDSRPQYKNNLLVDCGLYTGAWWTRPDWENWAYHQRGNYSTTNITLQWEPYKLRINYYPNGGTPTGEIFHNNGQNSPMFSETVAYNNKWNNGWGLVDPTDSRIKKTGYTITGYNTELDGTGRTLGYLGVTDGFYLPQHIEPNLKNGDTSINIYVQWKKTTYKNTITHWAWGFNGYGNSNSKDAYNLGKTSLDATYESSVTFDDSKSVEIPNGFYMRQTMGSAYAGTWKSYNLPLTITQPASTINAEYYYDPYNYSITYNLNGGSIAKENPTSYNVLNGVSFTNKPTKDGYIFLGWYIGDKKVTGINEGCNANFSSVSELYSKLKQRTTGNVTVTAKWKEDLTIAATIQNVQPPNDNVFKAGQQGKVIVTMHGNFDKLNITFPTSLLGTDPSGAEVPSIDYELDHPNNNEVYTFFVPLYAPDGEYKVEVKGTKGNVVKYAYPTMIVGDSIVHEIRTRVRR